MNPIIRFFRIAIVTLASISLLASCSNRSRNYYNHLPPSQKKKSGTAYNEKRAPLYNKKYIKKAKSNVLHGNFSDDEDDELEDSYDQMRSPAQVNKGLYRDMIRAEHLRKQAEQQERQNLRSAKQKIDDNKQDNSKNLEKELEQIKKMLMETKQDMAKSKCPQDLEKTLKELKDQKKHSTQIDEKNYKKKRTKQTVEDEYYYDDEYEIGSRTI